MARQIGPTRPAPAPAPNPALDNYYKEGGRPKARADCRLSQWVRRGGQSQCYGARSGRHGPDCPIPPPGPDRRVERGWDTTVGWMVGLLMVAAIVIGGTVLWLVLGG